MATFHPKDRPIDKGKGVFTHDALDPHSEQPGLRNTKQHIYHPIFTLKNPF